MKVFTPRKIVLTLFSAAILSLTGCVADPDVADVLPDQGSVPTHVEEVTFPESDVGKTAKWVVSDINGIRAINKQDWYSKVSPELTDNIPVDSLVGTLNADLRPSLPYIASNYQEPEAGYAIVRLTPDLTAQPVDLHLKVDASGRISSLWYEIVETDDRDAEEPPVSTP